MAEELGYPAIVPLLKQAEWQTVASRHPLPCTPVDFVTNKALTTTSPQQVFNHHYEPPTQLLSDLIY